MFEWIYHKYQIAVEIWYELPDWVQMFLKGCFGSIIGLLMMLFTFVPIILASATESILWLLLEFIVIPIDFGILAIFFTM